jgi:hypothetical protein
MIEEMFPNRTRSAGKVIRRQSRTDITYKEGDIKFADGIVEQRNMNLLPFAIESKRLLEMVIKEMIIDKKYHKKVSLLIFLYT